ncbi:diguanylate cyclase [Massilia sp. IC2-476]|uniref:GGDEF domain-containing protein n=1 Tax=Massilia sp. IC2-476 TaxID=2887199 RepID=UPI001D108D1E|nr:GGDEF domain-containing protein [Massilia sp. IC2-476]MCC2973931.1 GGDEF domain-containing protein [Massilia sp. IC2-476]
MLSTLSLLLVTTALSVVMLLVLSSLAGSKVEGIREWGQANGLAVVALLLFASRGVMPDLLSIELANAIFLVTIALMFVGFRRHLGLPVPWRPLAIGGLASFAGVVLFHYGPESTSLRITSVSVFHGAACFGIAASLPRAEGRLRYPYAFTRIAAFLLGLAHSVRGIFYLADAIEPVSFIAPGTANLIFFALGTLALPALTLGAVMMSNARVLSDTAYAAEHDHLTGAPSRRAFFEAAERELARARRHHSGLGLLLVDADHFKRINDTHGHATGDQVLRDLVHRTQDVIRKVDYFARLGGEEFGVLLPDATGETALAVAKRLRSALDRSAQTGAAYTVSIGLAMLEEGEDVASLMGRADAALYAAKEGGRNRVECASARTGASVGGA